MASTSPRAAPAQAVRTRVETEAGSFVVEVDPEVAPVTVANYLAHVDRKLLDGGAVYRIVTLANQAPETRHKIEVVQWGMNRPDGQAPPLAPIVHETTRQSGLRHLDGTVSMARASPAARPPSTSSASATSPSSTSAAAATPTASASPRSDASSKGWT